MNGGKNLQGCNIPASLADSRRSTADLYRRYAAPSGVIRGSLCDFELLTWHLYGFASSDGQTCSSQPGVSFALYCPLRWLEDEMWQLADHYLLTTDLEVFPWSRSVITSSFAHRKKLKEFPAARPQVRRGF